MTDRAVISLRPLSARLTADRRENVERQVFEAIATEIIEENRISVKVLVDIVKFLAIEIIKLFEFRQF